MRLGEDHPDARGRGPTHPRRHAGAATREPERADFFFVEGNDLAPIEFTLPGAGSTATASPPLPSAGSTATPSPAVQPSIPQPLPAPSVFGRVWGVYVAAAPSIGSPILSAAVKLLEAIGVPSSSVAPPFSIGCDRDAAKALGVPSTDYVVAVYFNSYGDAAAFSAFLDPAPLGVVHVTIGCND